MAASQLPEPRHPLAHSQGFVTAVLQNAARRSRLPIDRLSCAWAVLPPGEEAALGEAVEEHAAGAAAAAARERAAAAGAGGPGSRGSSAGAASLAARSRAASARAAEEGGVGAEAGGEAGGVFVYGLFLEGAAWDEEQGAAGRGDRLVPLNGPQLRTRPTRQRGGPCLSLRKRGLPSVALVLLRTRQEPPREGLASPS